MNKLKENKIKHVIEFKLENGSEKYMKFINYIRKFVKTEMDQKVEGIIDKLVIGIDYQGDLCFEIKAIKEDKLKLLNIKK